MNEDAIINGPAHQAEGGGQAGQRSRSLDGQEELAAASESPRGEKPPAEISRNKREIRHTIRVGLALHFALNAAPYELGRASLWAKPTADEKCRSKSNRGHF